MTQTKFSSDFEAPNGFLAKVGTSLGTLFSDDFGDTVLNADNWDVLQGGYAGIGTGANAGITYSIGASALTVAMGTTAGDELWFLSKQVFVCAEDVTAILSRSQALVANSVFIGLVEVDPVNFNPVVNPNLAGDFTNRGGVEFANTVTTTAFRTQAIADSSGSVALGSIGVATALTTTQEYLIEFHAEDIICSPQAVDVATGRLAGVSRVSTQCPNDRKIYKLLMRFLNLTAPATNTNIVIQRILVADGYENRVEVISGRGDAVASKAIAVNLTNAAVAVNPTPSANVGPSTTHHLISAATTNATLVKTASTQLAAAHFSNNGAAVAYVKMFNKATAPVAGTDTPVATILVPSGGTVSLNVGYAGHRFTLGLGYTITGGMPIADTTAVAASQVAVSMLYT